MNRLALLLLFTFLAACSPTPTVTPNSPDSLNTTESTPVPPTAISGESGLWLQIVSPLDESVVDTPQVDVLGSAPAGAVLSVNDEVLITGADGQFKVNVPLEEGPNLIEIIVSDESGNETSALLTITYEP